MRETWVQSLGWEDPLEKGPATHSRITHSGLENFMDYSPWGHKESDTTERLSLHFTSPFITVVATRSGKLTQKDNADSGVQFITAAGPRQSLLLAKDHDRLL